MALTNGDLSAADVAAVVGNGNNGFGWGDGSFWIIILFLFAFMGNGWGNGWNGGGSAVTQADMQRGFDQTATMAAVNGVNANLVNGFASAEVASCDRLANMTAQMNNLAMGIQNSSWQNAQGIADLKYTVATENCSDRAALSEGIRDINDNVNTKVQMIMDKMCQQEIEALKTQNQNLQTQLNMLNLANSQNTQTATILANNDAQTANLLQRLNPSAVPAYLVPAPNSCGCGNNYSCGCGGYVA